MTEVWKLDLPHPQLLVALALADHGNDDGTSIYPSLGRIGWKCGYSDRQVRRIVRELEAAGLLIKVADPSGDRGTEYRMNTSAGTAKPPFAPKKGADKMSGGQNVRADTTGRGGGHSDLSGADIAVSAEPSREPSENQSAANAADHGRETDPDAIRLCGILASLMRGNDPKAKLPSRGTRNHDTWIRDMRLLIQKDRDGDVAEVEFVIRWCQADGFERSNVLSPAKLRKRFTELKLKAERQRATGSHLATTDGLTAAARARMERTARRMRALNTDQPHVGGTSDLSDGQDRNALGEAGAPQLAGASSR